VSPRPLAARRQLPESAADANDFADALLAGLRSDPKQVPCKYFYDADGSHLFEEICALPEYYPSRTELGLLRRHAAEIARLIGPDVGVIEFGAGSSDKIRVLLDALRPRAYLPVDISGPYLRSIAAQLRSDYPELAVHPIVADFTQPLSWQPFTRGKRAGFFPGSTIGNFEPEEARAFLARTAKLLKGSGLLIGVDLVKDPVTLHAAYNDRAGVTAEFTLNMLERFNRELGADFDLAAFRHRARYNPMAGRIETHLVSLREQEVRIDGQRFPFAVDEPTLVEYSCKYSVPEFVRLAVRAGWRSARIWTDAERRFSIHFLTDAG